MKLGDITMESNKDNDYIARQLQSIEVIIQKVIQHDKNNPDRLPREPGPVPSLL